MPLDGICRSGRCAAKPPHRALIRAMHAPAPRDWRASAVRRPPAAIPSAGARPVTLPASCRSVDHRACYPMLPLFNPLFSTSPSRPARALTARVVPPGRCRGLGRMADRQEAENWTPATNAMPAATRPRPKWCVSSDMRVPYARLNLTAHRPSVGLLRDRGRRIDVRRWRARPRRFPDPAEHLPTAAADLARHGTT